MEKTDNTIQNESRRGFMKKSALAAAAAVAVPAKFTTPVYGQRQAPATGSVLGANDRVVCGFVGVGGQGMNAHLGTVNREGSAMNAVGAAVCDVFSKRRENARAALNIGEADAYADYRKLLERNDIDAVFIGTVDHWHRDNAIDAMESGKHVYCEKPMTRYLGEGFEIYDSVKKTGMVFQVGSQYCSEGIWHKAAELVREGKIGQLVLAQADYCRNNPEGEWNYPIDPDVAPETLDWKSWLGPVSDRPFSADQYHRWRKYYPFCAGILGDLLAHRIHPLLIATGAEWPTRVTSLGTRKVTPDRDVPDNTQILAEFPSGLTMLVIGSTVNEQGLGQMIRGHEATLYLGGYGGSLELRPERPFADLADREMYDGIQPGVSVSAHIGDFFNAIRQNTMPNGNIEIAIRAQLIISLAEMSERLGEMLHFDAETRTITNGSGKVIESITYGTLPLS